MAARTNRSRTFARTRGILNTLMIGTEEHSCRDLNGWPRSWMGLEKDLPRGEQLVACFRPFLESLLPVDLVVFGIRHAQMIPDSRS
jgi:hypothetical protein